MLVLPVYDLLLLPGVTFYFKKDILDRMQVEKVEKGEEILAYEYEIYNDWLWLAGTVFSSRS